MICILLPWVTLLAAYLPVDEPMKVDNLNSFHVFTFSRIYLDNRALFEKKRHFYF